MEPTTPRRFTRPKEGRVLGGVGAGLGRMFGIDPLIPRIAFLVLTFVGFVGPVAYLGLMLAPADGHEDDTFGRRAAVVAGVVALGIAAVVGGLAILAGAVLATAAGDGWIVAGLVLVLGAVGLFAAVQGHRLKWLAPLALVLAIPAGVVAASDLSIEGGAGERDYRPLTVADLPSDQYRLGIGQLVVDLRGMKWPRNGVVKVRTSLGIGETLVLVPDDVCVSADADIGIGAWDVLGDDSGGIDLDGHPGGTSTDDPKRLVLKADIGIGALRVATDRADPGFDRDRGPFGFTDRGVRNPCGTINLG